MKLVGFSGAHALRSGIGSDTGAEWLVWLRSLRNRRLWLVLAVATLLLASLSMLPLRYTIDIGREDGPGSDLPLITDFNTPEHDPRGFSFRWTTERSLIRLPGIGVRPLLLSLRTGSVNTSMAERGPQEFELLSDGQRLGRIPVRHTGGVIHVLLPPAPTGNLLLTIQSSSYTPPGDVRALGVNLDWLRVVAFGAGLPAWRPLVLWLMSLVLVGMLVQRAGADPAPVTLVVLLLIGLAALLDPARLAFGAEPALQSLCLAAALLVGLRAPTQAVLGIGLLAGATGLIFGQGLLLFTGVSLVLASMLRPALVRSLQNYGIVLDNAAWTALCLLVLLTFVLRYYGKIYPESMPGDIGFHSNRFGDLLRGMVLLLSRNRGVDFPYPPALYLVLAPFTLLLPDRRELLHLTAALLDALSPFLVFVIVRVSGLTRSWWVGLAAAGLYALAGAGFMASWWNFSTHIFGQFTHLALITLVLLAGQGAFSNGQRHKSSTAIVALLVLTQLLVYLGHFGFWLNTTLLAGSLLGLLLMLGRRNNWWRLVGLVILAQFLAVGLFYSAYAGLFVEQSQRAATGGLTGLAGRGAVSSAILWQTLRDGLYAHVGLFPIPMAFVTLLRGRATLLTRLLIGSTLVIGVLFAILPFVSGSTLATRWLMFALWALSVGAAVCGAWLWQRGRAGQLVVATIGVYIVWLSAVQWIGALAWRVRPPEPF